MSTPKRPEQKVVPAQLGFLAIYNPSLGTTDDTLDDQIVYYRSTEARRKTKQSNRHAENLQDGSQDERNERLRKIGLAQGMVEFGRSFSDGQSVDTIETEKSRIILHELEAGWWILASIDLTRLPIQRKVSNSEEKQSENEPTVEYSSREVKPPGLLLQDLLRAHSTFLLHHASSMSALFVRTRRSKFLSILGRYWDSYLSTWNVLLHGNPAVNIYGGIKLAGSGELGMGVGEEDRGSGERDVLEGFVGRVDGLVDLLVSKFGTPQVENEAGKGTKDSKSKPASQWLGTGAEPSSEDGAIFLGTGALSRKSLRDVTHWMEDLYSWGPRAYGVMDNPTSTRPSKVKNLLSDPKIAPLADVTETPKSPKSAQSEISRSRKQAQKVYSMSESQQTQKGPLRAVSPREEISDPVKSVEANGKRPVIGRNPSSQSSIKSSSNHTLSNTLSTYLRLGYGSHWSLTGNSVKEPDRTDQRDVSKSEGSNRKPSRPAGPNRVESNTFPKGDSVGHFLVGLMGHIGDPDMEKTDDDGTIVDDMDEASNTRMLLRTVTVELEREGDAREEKDISIDLGDNDRTSSGRGGSEHTGTSNASFESQDRNKTKKLRVVIYVNRPFIFAFLFELRTDTLALSSFYRSLHHQISHLLVPLMASTKHPLSKPDPTITSNEDVKSPIYDLIWNPRQLTVTSTIPDIPDPTMKTTRPPPWSRVDALNTHIQIMNTFAAAHNDRSELERTSKTSRGYWVVWTRIPDSDVTPTGTLPAPVTPGTVSPMPGLLTPPKKAEHSSLSQKSSSTRSNNKPASRGIGSSFNESILNSTVYSGPAHPFIDTPPLRESTSGDTEILLVRQASDYAPGRSGRMVSSSMTGDIGWGSTPAKLAQGIGVDTKRYIEGLLSLNR